MPERVNFYDNLTGKRPLSYLQELREETPAIPITC